MPDDNKIEEKLDLLILIELLKQKATRPQIRKVLGSLSNATFAKVNVIFKANKHDK